MLDCFSSLCAFKCPLKSPAQETYSQMQFIFSVLVLIPTDPHSTCKQFQKKVVGAGPGRSRFLSPISSQTAENIKKLKIYYEIWLAKDGFRLYFFSKIQNFQKYFFKIFKNIFFKIFKKKKKRIESKQIEHRFFSFNFLTIPIPVIFLRPILVLC